MNKEQRKQSAAMIDHLAKETGKTPQVLLEDILKKVLLKTPISALQKIGLVTGEPEEDIDVEAAKRDVAKEIADDLGAEIVAKRMHDICFAYNMILDYLQARGLGAEFTSPIFWRKADAKKFLLQVLVVRKALAKIEKKGGDPKRPTFGVTPMCEMLADKFLKRLDRAFDALDGKAYKFNAADVKAFETKQKADAEKIARKAAKCPPCELMSLQDYHSLCYLVLESTEFVEGEKASFVPYPLVTREELVRLISLRFKKIAALQKELAGPRDRDYPKSYIKSDIADIKAQLKTYPADLVKEAKALA